MKHVIPTIDPVRAGAAQPFWSVMIPSYNRDDLLAATLESVLACAPGPHEMQIEVVDDASTDGDPEGVLRDVGGGRVELFRQPQNVGASANFTTCVQRARGHWVHILHSDDLVLPGFYEAYRAVIEQRAVDMVVGQSVLIDGGGLWTGVSRPLETVDGLVHDAHRVLAMLNPVCCPAIVVARRAYERAGGFDPELVHACDWEMWARLASAGSVGYVATPHTLYRRHDGSDTTRLSQSTTYLTDPLAALAVICERFEREEDRTAIRAGARDILSDRAIDASAAHLAAGDRRRAVQHAAWAVRLHPSPRTIALAARSLGRPRHATTWGPAAPTATTT